MLHENLHNSPSEIKKNLQEELMRSLRGEEVLYAHHFPALHCFSYCLSANVQKTMALRTVNETWDYWSGINSFIQFIMKFTNFSVGDSYPWQNVVH